MSDEDRLNGSKSQAACCGGNDCCKNFWTVPNIAVLIMSPWALTLTLLAIWEFIGSRVWTIDTWGIVLTVSAGVYAGWFITFMIMAHTPSCDCIVGSTQKPTPAMYKPIIGWSIVGLFTFCLDLSLLWSYRNWLSGDELYPLNHIDSDTAGVTNTTVGMRFSAIFLVVMSGCIWQMVAGWICAMAEMHPEKKVYPTSMSRR